MVRKWPGSSGRVPRRCRSFADSASTNGFGTERRSLSYFEAWNRNLRCESGHVVGPRIHQVQAAPILSNLDGADEAGKRIAQRNYWLDVAAHCVRRTELVVVVLTSPVEMVVSGNQGGAKPFLEV